MNHIKSRVVTINVGLIASMASFLLCGGTKGSRLALPNSRVMIHQPMGGAQGQAEDIKVEAAQIVRIKENLVKLYSMMTGQTTDQIIKDLDRDNFMSAQEAAFRRRHRRQGHRRGLRVVERRRLASMASERGKLQRATRRWRKSARWPLLDYTKCFSRRFCRRDFFAAAQKSDSLAAAALNT